MVDWEKKDCDEAGCTIRTWLCDSRPPEIVLKGFSIEQKGRVFYVVKGSARDLDRLCHVPRIDFTKPDSYHAQQAISSQVDQWQRPLDADRLADISKFFGSHRNFLVNAVLLSVPEEDYVKYNDPPDTDVAVIEADAEAWMKKECPHCGWEKRSGPPDDQITWWFDRCPQHDCHKDRESVRPGLIIDGQHRIRGIHGVHSTPDTRKEPMAATVLRSREFPPDEQARIFTEITTTAEDLETPHKLYLLYQFGLSSPRLRLSVDFSDEEMVADFRQEPAAKPKRWAYRIACELCTRQSPWQNRISILGGDDAVKYIDIEQFLPMVASWLEPGGALSQYAPPNVGGGTFQHDPVNELQDYLTAIMRTWDNIWTDDPDKNSRSPIQMKGIFAPLVLFFGDVAQHLKPKPRSLTNFEDVFSKFSGISWNQDWEKLQTPEKNKRLMYELLKHKLNTGKPKSLDAKVSSEPDSFDFAASTKKLKGKTFTTELGFDIEWDRPLNAWRRARLEVRQDERVLYSRRTSKTDIRLTKGKLAASPDTSQGAADVEIRVVYSNNNGSTPTSFSMKP